MASLKKRNGKYCVIYRYRDKEGKKKQKWETFDSRAEAIKRMKEIEYKKSNGTFVVPQCKLMSELLKEYVDLYGKEKWALSTYDSNLSLISNYIEPVIGKVDLSDINTRFLETYYKTLLRTPTCTSKEAPSTAYTNLHFKRSSGRRAENYQHKYDPGYPQTSQKLL